MGLIDGERAERCGVLGVCGRTMETGNLDRYRRASVGGYSARVRPWRFSATI